MRRLALVVPFLLLLAAGNLPQSRGDLLTVTRKTTKLREQKRLFAAAVAQLVEGDRLALEGKEGVWIRAKYREWIGWLHETDVSTNKDVRLSGDGVRENYTAAETSAARKGFNPDVEKEFRSGHPNLEAAFKALDAIQQRIVTEEDITAFLIAGGLGASALANTEAGR